MFILVLGIIWIVALIHVIYSTMVMYKKEKFIHYLHTKKKVVQQEYIVNRRKYIENSFEREKKRIAALPVKERIIIFDQWLAAEEEQIRLDKQWMDNLRNTADKLNIVLSK